VKERKRKYAELRAAIDAIEGALMGAGDGMLLELPKVFEGAREELLVTARMPLRDFRRIARACEELTRIINSEEYEER
jgi:hypothetical protein